MPEILLQANDLTKHYPVKNAGAGSHRGKVRAVEEVSLSFKEGEVFGLVGESGCGKSSLGRVLLRLEEATSGKVFFKGRDLMSLNKAELKKFRRQAQIIYQDPYSALNPRQKVGDIIAEPMAIHDMGKKLEQQERVKWLLDVVGLHPGQAKLYPHEFSGGQRQRIVIARALSLQPMLILADEPVSALDVSIQAQVINLLEKLRSQFGLTYVFISHDLSVVEHICDRVAVMYLGRLVELSNRNELYANPLHPYSKALLSAVPTTDPSVRRHRIILQGDVPSPINPPKGCPFHPRCQKSKEICLKERPELKNVGTDHWVACHLYGNN